jgi:ankyrin repeat protein
MSTRVAEANNNVQTAEKQRPETRHKKVKRVRSSPIDLLVWEYANSLDRADTFEKLKEAVKHFDIDELNASGLNALQQCALDGNLEGLKLLLSLGADCNKRGRGGWTALHYAASEGYLEIVRYLMRYGANVRIADHNHKFPVEITEDESILKLLLRATIVSNGNHLPSTNARRQRRKYKMSI